MRESGLDACCQRSRPQWGRRAMGIDRRLLCVAIGVGCFALATVLTVYANSWWLSALVTLSIGCWLGGVLLAIYTPPRQRAALLGALVCSFFYMLLAGGPWFEAHVGPWLLTTRALVAIDTNLLGNQPAQQGVTLQLAPPNANLVYAMAFNPLGRPTAVWQSPTSPSPFVATGQWLLAWCAAASGAFAARWLARRSNRPPAADLPAGPPLASPFAETVR